MAIRPIAALAGIKASQLDLLLYHYGEVWKLPPRYVYCFTAFALLGSHQAQFQERNRKITPDDVETSIKYVMRTIGPLFIGHTGVPACQMFDQLEIRARMMFREYSLWLAEMHHGENSILSKYAGHGVASEFEVVLGGLWWEAREKFWPKRDATQLHQAMRYALYELNLGTDESTRSSMLRKYREALFAGGALHITANGELHLGGRDARDVLTKATGARRRRPDRERKRKQKAPAVFLGEGDEAASEEPGVEDLLNAQHLAEEIELWRKVELRRAGRGSNKRYLLLHLGKHPGRRPPIAALAAKHGRDKGGFSRAWSSLVVDLQAHLVKRAADKST